MRLNKAGQYGLLISFYLARAGRASMDTICDEVGLKYPFAVQVSRKLKEAGILIPYRGPGGGYEMNPDTMVYEVLQACDTNPVITKYESAALTRSHAVEKRALAQFVGFISMSLLKNTSVKVSSVVLGTAQEEGRQLDSLNTATPN